MTTNRKPKFPRPNDPRWVRLHADLCGHGIAGRWQDVYDTAGRWSGPHATEWQIKALANGAVAR